MTMKITIFFYISIITKYFKNEKGNYKHFPLKFINSIPFSVYIHLLSRVRQFKQTSARPSMCRQSDSEEIFT